MIDGVRPPRPPQPPSVSRDVHYVSYGTPGGEYSSQCRAAKITAVYSDDNPAPTHEDLAYGVEGSEWVGLFVMNPTGTFHNHACHDERDKAGGTWHWPERVGE